MKLLFLLPFLIFGQIGTVQHNFNWLDDSMRIDSIKTRSIYSDNYYNIDTSDVNNLSLYLGQKLNVSDSSDLARKVHVHDTSDVTGLHSMLAGKEPSLGFGDNMSTLRGSDKTWAPVTSMLSLNPPSAPDQYYKHNGLTFVWSNIAISDVTNLQDALELKLDVTELDNFYTKTNLQTSGQASVHAGNINSGTLSNDRLSFNPDYFVSGDGVYKSIGLSSANPLDGNRYSHFFRMPSSDPAFDSRLPGIGYGIHIQHATSASYGLDIKGNSETGVLLFGGMGNGVRQPWREIWHEDNLDTSDYYTKTNLQTSGQSSVHAGNITNAPWLTSLPNHNHDTRYPLKSLGFVRSGYAYESMEADRNTLADGMYTYSWYSSALNRPADALYGSALTFGNMDDRGKAQLLAGWGASGNYLAYRSLRDAIDPWTAYKRIYHEGYKPTWDDIGSKPSVFPPASHNHDASNINSGTLSNDRLSFNPDNFVQGENSSRTIRLDSNRQLDETMYSMFFLLNPDDPACPSENFLYGFRTMNPNLLYFNSIEIAGRANTGELYFGGVQGSKRQLWREIFHEGNFDPSDYYTKTNLQTSGQSSVHAGNITNAPWLTGNPFDQDLNTTDRVKFDGIVNQNTGVSSYHYRSVASKEIRSSSTTGTMKITMPQSWSNTMLTIKIAGYNYSSATSWWECIVSGYNYTTEQWYYPKCELRGNPPFTDVRLAHDGTKCCLLLGNTSTIWNWPKIHITDVITGHDNYSDWSTGWSIDLITDESGISNIATPDVDRPWHDGNLDPSDYALVSHNHDASNINSGTLSNSRLSFNPDYFVQGTNSYRRANYTSTNTLDDNDASGFFRLHSTDPASPDGIFNYCGFRTRVDASYSVELVGRAGENKLLFGGLHGGTRQPWREIWHSGNLDTSNIVRRNVENVFENTLHVHVQDAGDTTDGIVLYNNSTASGTAMEIGFCYASGSVIPKDHRSAKIVAGLKYNTLADTVYNPKNTSISLHARPDPYSGETRPDATEPIFEAGFKKQQAFVKYHNNPQTIHSEYEIIGSNSQTLNPTKGVYICGGSTTAQEITLDTTGVENGQTVKILKASTLLAGVRYGQPGNYYWLSIGHFGAAEFIHYNGVWFCLGTEYIP